MAKAKQAEAVEQKAVTLTALLKQFKAARAAGVPIIGIETPDPAATIESVRTVLETGAKMPPVLQYDVVRGLVGLNDAGAKALNAIEPDKRVNPIEMFMGCENLPEFSTVFVLNANRLMIDGQIVQAIWNLRDVFKLDTRTLVLMGPSFTWPAELSGDVIVLDEPLPTRDELADRVKVQYECAAIQMPSDDDLSKTLDALVGLPMFAAEQDTAMSLSKAGIDHDSVWQRKRKYISQTPGLSVYVPGKDDTTLDELKGLDNVKEYFEQLIAADAFTVIAFIDESEKAFAGGLSDHSGDSGVAKDSIGEVLKFTVDKHCLGVMLAGCAGTGKTQLAKAVAAKSGKPLVMFDMGGMRSSLVGSSEGAVRTALKVLAATAAEGRVLFILTANKTVTFTPELNRRFPDQFFFDTLSDDARAEVWPVYIKKNKLTGQQATFPAGFDAGWSADEVRRTCERAALLGCSVVDAARFIIPSSVSAKDAIASLRQAAAGKFLSATEAGWYEAPKTERTAARPVAGRRQFNES